MSNGNGDSQRPNHAHQPRFPSHQEPRVWFITAGNSSIGVAITRHLLEHGDVVVSGLLPSEYEDGHERARPFREFLEEEIAPNVELRARLKVVGFDIRSRAECQSAIAEATETFGRIDILLCCKTEALIGTVEEVAQSTLTQSLVGEQFQTNFFGPINLIKCTLPPMREKNNGHIILLSGITGHLGTPGLGIYCASQWAIEGYCDSLAYEVAPFNIKMSIVQSNIEVSLLTNRLTAVPPMPAYTASHNPAPLCRGVFSNLLDQLDPIDEDAADDRPPPPSAILNANKSSSIFPRLPPSFADRLVAETVYAVLAIGGHENPPSRHIVGHEGVASVKEKLRTVSEELEDFVEVSSAVDL